MINSLVVNALSSLTVPVSFQTHIENAPTYVTFFTYLQQGEAFADDSEVGTACYIQVDIWSKTNYSELVEQVKSLMLAAGFTRTNEADLYESDTKIFHKGIRFFYLEGKS